MRERNDETREEDEKRLKGESSSFITEYLSDKLDSMRNNSWLTGT